MNVTLRPNLQERIDEKVRRGDYPSAEELVQDAVARLLADEEEASSFGTHEFAWRVTS
jgi:Arc/MetJ-type ribon-helix-helix transcriptional regulator